MISQREIELKAQNSALENSDGCREGAHGFDCFCSAHEEGFIAAASWVIEQYRPLMEALQKLFNEQIEDADHALILYEKVDAEFNKLKQHT